MNAILRNHFVNDADAPSPPRSHFEIVLSYIARWSSVAIVVLWLITPVLGWGLLYQAAIAAEVSQISDATVRNCAEAAFPKRSLVQKFSLEIDDQASTNWVTTGKLYWERTDDGLTKTLVRIRNSPQHSGVSVLLTERAAGEPIIYMYSPELRRNRRMGNGAFAGSMLGTDFSYEDLDHMQKFDSAGSIERLHDLSIDGQPAYVLQTLPDENESAYSRVLTYIDQKLCLPVRIEFFAMNGTLHKAIEINRDSVSQVSNRWVPRESVMIDYKRNSHSLLTVSDIEVDPILPKHWFSPTTLQKGY